MTREQTAPMVSIIIPCFNQGKYLRESIGSALAQSYPNVEVVLVNDGSTDNSAEVAGDYPTIVYLSQPNRGVAEARNLGFGASKGEFVQFLDADDRVTRTSVETHLRCFDAHPEAGFVVGEIEWIDEINQCTGRGGWPLLQVNHYEEILKVNHVANTVAVMFRRAVLETVGGFNGFFSPAEDYEMLVRSARRFSSAHHAEVVAQYRRHTTNTSRRGRLMLRATNRVMVAERFYVKGSARLEAALRKGHHNWRDFFGAVTIKEISAHLRRGDITNAITSTAALMWYVRERVFIIPWKFRRRGMVAARRRLRRLAKSLRSRLGVNSRAVRPSQVSPPRR